MSSGLWHLHQFTQPRYCQISIRCAPKAHSKSTAQFRYRGQNSQLNSISFLCSFWLVKRNSKNEETIKWIYWNEILDEFFFGVLTGYESCAINDNWGYRMSSSSSNPFFVSRFVSLAEKASKPKRKQKQKKRLLRVNRHRNSNKSQLTYWKTIFNRLRILYLGKKILLPTLIKIHPHRTESLREVIWHFD